MNSFTSYAQQELGLSLPIGNGRRQAWGKTLKEEMEAQRWDIKDLVRAVDYIKANKKPCRSLNGIMWYVQDAKGWKRPERNLSDDALHLKVSRALAVETDDGWARKLSLASGKALAMVYADWHSNRSGLFQ